MGKYTDSVKKINFAKKNKESENCTHNPCTWERSESNMGNVIITAYDESLVASLSMSKGKAQAEANAARIVACVNACEGIPNEVLLSENRKHDAFFEAMELQIQRDELLAALEVCYRSLCTYGTHLIIDNQVNKAIAKAKANP